ncbi:MAG: hypothetical protein INR73_08505 [Williamsia sp.]|nr:hypothetical protein [Williamsia sp.]
MSEPFFSFVANFLEPLSYLLLCGALVLQVLTHKRVEIEALAIFYLVAAAGLGYASWLADRRVNNNWIYNSLYLPALLVISFYFYRVLRSKKSKWVIRSLVLINGLYFIGRILFWGALLLIDNFGYALLSVSVTLLSFVYFYDVLSHVSESAIWQRVDFWLVSGYLLYYLGSFFIFLQFANLAYNILDTYTDKQRAPLTLLWGVHNVLLFISSLTTLLGSIWIAYRSKS